MNRRFFRAGVLAAALCLYLPGISYAVGTRHTLSSQHKFWDSLVGDPGEECETDLAADDSGFGGTTCYSRSVTVPVDSNVLLVDVSALTNIGDTSDIVLESVNLDGTPCINGSGDVTGEESGEETGWIALDARHDGTELNEAHSYEWCCKATPGSHTVNVKIGTEDTGSGFGFSDVEMQQMVVNIDSGGYPSGAACDGNF